MNRDNSGTIDRLVFRAAVHADLPTLVELLADDVLGAQREDTSRPVAPAYEKAFAAIERAPNSQLIVAQSEGTIVGCLQFDLIPGLSHQGLLRGQIESVRVAASARGQGIGERLLRHGIALAAEAGCGMVQLTSNAQRDDALRFYERLGFTPSHIGFKLKLGVTTP